MSDRAIQQVSLRWCPACLEGREGGDRAVLEAGGAADVSVVLMVVLIVMSWWYLANE